MDVSLSSWFVILLALIAANLPFLNERMFAVIPLSHLTKPFWLRLVELLVLYAVIRGIAYLLEAHAGNVFPQRWEFYAITACLFIVFAFPGYVFRYLRKRHG
ncbi:DUF2818 family protein [Noviherbaspirillum cavernae]|uniref:DUF2818 family protein n=1 Tax=Noviherbaspirillum cavernae TaxID=2320862 RepID=A0A418X1M5_9BURK|nr:DUF2818 family protein [Noviherbaspirillum cavernae]RJG06357.1 DUF2818 family protein [Noviherbaspirillum cavernae]